MKLLRKIARQVWQARNMGIGHVMRKVIRRVTGGAKAPSASAEALKTHASRLTDRSKRLEAGLQSLSQEVKKAFDEGRYADYVRFGAEAGQLRDELAREWGMDPTGPRIVGSSFLGPFGHLTLFDLLVKCQHLGLREDEKTKVLVDPDRISNRAYFDLWRPFLDVHEISPSQWSDVDLLSWPICERADFIRTKLGYRNSMDLWDEVDRKWESAQMNPLISLPPRLDESGRAALRKMGVEDGQWFVAFHIREGDHRVSYRGPNADVATYEPAMAEVVRRGGAVVRMGNPDMRPISSKQGIIDYAHSVRRADWLDVYLWARCRFFVGTGSGPIHVPGTFGVPVLMTNTSAVGMFPSYSPGSLMITKHFIDSKSGVEVSLGEALRRGAGWNWSADLSNSGLEIRDNSPDEIRAAVIDMFDSTLSGPSESQSKLDHQRRSAGSSISTPFAPSFSDLMVSL